MIVVSSTGIRGLEDAIRRQPEIARKAGIDAMDVFAGAGVLLGGAVAYLISNFDRLSEEFWTWASTSRLMPKYSS